MRGLLIPRAKYEKPSSPFTPGADTLLYLPFNSITTYTDQSGNNRTTTNSGATFGMYQGVDCAVFDGARSSPTHVQVTPFELPVPLTILNRSYIEATPYYLDGKLFDARSSNKMRVTWYTTDTSFPVGYSFYDDGSRASNAVACMQQRCLTAAVFTQSQAIMYIKSTGIDSTITMTGKSNSAFTPTYMNIGNEYNNAYPRGFPGGISELIVENKERTAQDIADYFNATKSLYGL